MEGVLIEVTRADWVWLACGATVHVIDDTLLSRSRSRRRRRDGVCDTLGCVRTYSTRIVHGVCCTYRLEKMAYEAGGFRRGEFCRVTGKAGEFVASGQVVTSMKHSVCLYA